MAVLRYAQEGELVPVAVTLDTADSSVDARGHQPFDFSEFTQLDFGSRSEVSVHGKVYFPFISTAVPSTGIEEFFCVKDSSLNTLFAIRAYRAAGLGEPSAAFYAVNSDALGAGQVSVQGIQTSSVETTIDLRISKVGTTISLELYLNGSVVLIHSFVGTSPLWGEPAYFAFGGYLVGGTSRWRDIIISEDITVALGTSTLEATSAGAHNDAVGAYGDLTGPGVDLTTTMVFATIGDKESWNIDPLAGKSFVSTSIQGILFSALVSLDGVAVNGFKFFIRDSGVDYPAPDTLVPGAITENITYYMTTNPATGVQFTPAEIAAGLEVGIEAV